MTSQPTPPPTPAPAGRTDRIQRLTRVVAFVVSPVLLVAFGILYVNNAAASLVFAWDIKPRLTAMLLGSAYTGGAVFFTSLLAARQWHRVHLGVPAVATFASLLLVTTFLHRDLFLFERVTAWVWTIVYIVAPPLVVLAFLRNRRLDPGPQPEDALTDHRLVRVMLIIGLGTMGFAVLLYLVPTLFIDVWPWKMTPLSARIQAPMLCLPGVIAIGIALDRRRSSLRQPLIAQCAALALMLGALVIRAEDLSGPAISVAAAWIVLGGSLVGTIAILAWQREAPVRRSVEAS